MDHSVSSDWENPPLEIFEAVLGPLKRERYWKCLAPRLRLVNSHWKEFVDRDGMHLNMQKLSSSWLSHQTFDICQQKSVTSLRVYPAYMGSQDFSTLLDRGCLARVRTLEFHGGEISLDLMSHLLLISASLRRLELVGCWVSSLALSSVSDLTGLTNLGFTGLSFRDFELNSLDALQQLRHLRLTRCRHLESFQFLRVVTKLESLTYRSAFNADVSLDEVLACKKLKALDLDVPTGLAPVATRISELQHLTKLCLRCRDALPDFALPSGVQSLRIQWPRLKAFKTQPVSPSTGQHPIDGLRELEIVNVPTFPELGLGLLTEFRKLRELRMPGMYEPRYPRADPRDPPFPLLQLWIIGSRWRNALAFAAKAMPMLEFLGLEIGDTMNLDRPFGFEELWLHKRIHVVNISVSGARFENRRGFWEKFSESFSKSRSLRHIGWKFKDGRVDDVPENVVDFFATKGVFVDDDNHIFANPA